MTAFFAAPELPAESRVPVVSVIIPTHNRSFMLREALESVLAQSLADLEIVVVDDGSVDNTRQVVESFADPRVVYVYQENAGRSTARNRGIQVSCGKYVAFLDDDDLFLSGKLELQAGLLDECPDAGMAVGGWICIGPDRQPLQETRPWLWHSHMDTATWLSACPAMPGSVMARREWLDRVGGFDPAMVHAEDYDLFLRLSYAGCRMAWTQALVCAYRIHPGNTVRDAHSHRRGMLAALDKFFAQPGLPAAWEGDRRRAYASAYLRGAAREYGAGAVEDACRDVAAAIERDPGLLADEAEGLYRILTDWIGEATTGDPVRYVVTVFDNLPPQAARLRSRRRSGLALAAKGSLFGAHARGDRAGVLRNVARLAAWKRSAIFDRGVASAVAQAVLGGRVASLLRRVGRRATQGLPGVAMIRHG
jgi:glycosyltransferase involved in cell wall biosynthesis